VKNHGQVDFDKAVVAAKALRDRPENEDMLLLYALFKQATSGDVNVPKPGFFDFVGVAKFEAWEKVRGVSMDDAKLQYVALVRKLGGSV
jgi:diazepam-binding inhibitor (GABA receptor modulating acyl-CoA-binding protein)